MAFQIIVDGYNFIGSEKGLRGNIEQQREEILRLFSRYRRARGLAITVVFDGWGSDTLGEHGEVREGVEVVFSRQGEKADALICRMAEELGEGCLVVTSDREIARSVQASGGVTIGSREFAMKIRETMLGGPMPEKDDGEYSGRPQRPKKGNPRRLSKKDRKKRLRMEKL